jgi:hypothetical protein
LALLVLASLVFVGAALVIAGWLSHPRVRPVQQLGPLVIVGMPTLQWSDLSAEKTPELWQLAQGGAVGAQATRSPAGRSCSVQSWLMLGVGSPTQAGPNANCNEVVTPTTYFDGTASFPDWKRWRRNAIIQGGNSTLGRIATILADNGECISAAGQNAALGAADEYGLVAHYTPDPDKVDLHQCAVTLIGLDGLDDDYIGRLRRNLPSDATVVVSGMADGRRSRTFHTVIMAGPGVPHGLLTSLSTRQPGVIQTADLSSLIVSRLGTQAPIVGDGRVPVVRPMDGADRPIRYVQGLTRALDKEYPFVGPFFALFLGGSALALGSGLLWWWLDRRRRASREDVSGRTPMMSPWLRWWLATIAAMCAAMPAATMLAGLVPWWTSAHPRWALSLSIVGISAVMSALALLGPWRHRTLGPVTFMIATTFFVIAQDVTHGSRLQFISLMGLQPVYGGRFYGQGNVAYAVFATTGLLIATVIAGRMIAVGQRRVAVVAVVTVGLVALVIDGSPSWGADGGGPVALVPAFGFLALMAAGEHITKRSIVALGAATVGLVGAFALFDYFGPEAYRTHIGDFVAQLVTGFHWHGVLAIWTENWAMLTSNWFTRSVPLLIVAAIVIVASPDRYGRPVMRATDKVPFLRHGLTAVVICWVIGFLSNDSGTGIPPTGMLIAGPLLLLLAVAPRRETAPVAEPVPTAVESAVA